MKKYKIIDWILIILSLVPALLFEFYMLNQSFIFLASTRTGTVYVATFIAFIVGILDAFYIHIKNLESEQIKRSGCVDKILLFMTYLNFAMMGLLILCLFGIHAGNVMSD
jgi:hypothetical protein